MSDYRVAIGHDVALASLTILNPQPASPGMQSTRRLFMGDGSMIEQGLYIELIYSVIESAAQLSSILTPFGILTSTSSEVTLNARNQIYGYKRFNGRAIRPEANWDNYFARNITILVRDLVVLP